jgi:hypothetical protein
METTFHLYAAELNAAFVDTIQKTFAGQNIVIKVTPEDKLAQASPDAATALLEKKTYGLSAAGNVLAPAYYLLQAQGYAVAYDETQEWWLAEKAGAVFIAYSTIELCGLVFIHEQKGEQWQVSDEAIEGYLKLEDSAESPDRAA